MQNAHCSVAGERFCISQIFSGEAILGLLNSPPSFALESILPQPTCHVSGMDPEYVAQFNLQNYFQKLILCFITVL
jgi:hypothetical protein